MKLTVKKLKQLIKEELDTMGNPFDDGSSPYDPQHQGEPDQLDKFRDAGCGEIRQQEYLDAMAQAYLEMSKDPKGSLDAEKMKAKLQPILDKYPLCHKQAGPTNWHDTQTEGE